MSFCGNKKFYHEVPIPLETILTLPAKQTTAAIHQCLGPHQTRGLGKTNGQYHRGSGPGLSSKQN